MTDEGVNHAEIALAILKNIAKNEFGQFGDLYICVWVYYDYDNPASVWVELEISSEPSSGKNGLSDSCEFEALAIKGPFLLDVATAGRAFFKRSLLLP